MKIYISASWKQRERVRSLAVKLRVDGHEVYDFTDPASRKTPEIPPERFPDQFDPERHIYREYISAVPEWRDAVVCNQEALRWCEVVVLLLPAGNDAHSDWALAVGMGKQSVIVGQPRAGDRTPSHLWADALLDEDDDVTDWLRLCAAARPAVGVVEYVQLQAQFERQIQEPIGAQPSPADGYAPPSPLHVPPGVVPVDLRVPPGVAPVHIWASGDQTVPAPTSCAECADKSRLIAWHYERQRQAEAKLIEVTKGCMDEWAAERQRREAAEREADRLRHGQAIEGDYVCPNLLHAEAAKRERDHYRRGVANWLAKQRKVGRECEGCLGCGDDSSINANFCVGAK